MTQHIQNVEAPQDDQNGRKIYPDTVRRQEDPRMNHRTDYDEHRNDENHAKKVGKVRNTTWTRIRHGTRSTVTSQLAKIKYDTSAENRDVVSHSSGKIQGTMKRR